MQEIGRFDVVVSVIPNGLEKYMTFTIRNNLVFIDSMQFMNSSLDTLAKHLSDNEIKYLSERFSGDLLELGEQKGVYPYSIYMHRIYVKTFSEDKLPDKCKFFSSLKDERICEKNYLASANAWNVFIMNTMGDDHDLDLNTDVFFLADVCEKFINICLENYGLDPCHYFSSPKLSWDAMLKTNWIESELISETDMHFFI